MTPRITLLVLAALVTAPVLSGCLESGAVDEEDDRNAAAAFIDPVVEEHDHSDWSEHNFSTDTMEKIGYAMMGEDGKPFSYIGEMDAFGDLVVVQVIGRGSTPGFVLVNVSDPTAPAVVGRAEIPDGYVVDVKFSPDGQRVYAASQRFPPTPGNPATGELIFANDGVATWDVSDPTAPRLVSATPVPPYGCHMLSVKDYADERWVFCVGRAIHVFSEEEDRLVPRANYAPQGPDGTMTVVEEMGVPPGTPTPHDMTWVKDPVDGTPLIFVSYWDLGARVVDVSDPLTPRELGAWGGEGAEQYEGNVHSAMPVVIDGTRYVVAAPEILGNTVPAVWILEASDYADMQVAAEWIPPGEHGAQNLLLTTHQFQLVGERMYMAFNHAGVWVLSLPEMLAGDYKEDPARPEVLGYYLPHEDVPLYDPDRAAVPNTWDVVLKEGYIFASDRYTGFYVLHYEEDTLGDPAVTSFA